MEIAPHAIYCDNCFYYTDRGFKQFEILGSIDINGRLLVKRSHPQGQASFTIIGGNGTLTMLCGSCKFAIDVKIAPHIETITLVK